VRREDGDDREAFGLHRDAPGVVIAKDHEPAEPTIVSPSKAPSRIASSGMERRRSRRPGLTSKPNAVAIGTMCAASSSNVVGRIVIVTATLYSRRRAP